MRDTFASTARAAAFCVFAALSAGVSGAFGQSDPLVSKFLPRLLTDGSLVWAFAEDGLRYSRVDLFTDPADIRNHQLPFLSGIRGGVGRSASLLVFFDYPVPDSMTVGGVAALDDAG